MDTGVSESAVSNARNSSCPSRSESSRNVTAGGSDFKMKALNHDLGGVRQSVRPPQVPSSSFLAAPAAVTPVTRPVARELQQARHRETQHLKLQQMMTVVDKECHDAVSRESPGDDLNRCARCARPFGGLRCLDVEAAGCGVTHQACTTESEGRGAVVLGQKSVVGGGAVHASKYLVEPPMANAWPGSGPAPVPGLGGAAGGGPGGGGGGGPAVPLIDEAHWHYSHRSPWLRALVLGANDGLVSIASLMLGVGAVKTDVRAMVISGLAGLVAGAGSMAIGEFVSVFSQRDTELADLEKERQEHAKGPEAQARELEELTEIYVGRGLQYCLAKQVAEELSKVDVLKAHARDELGIDMDALSNPLQAALASAFAFSLGGGVPLLAGAFVVGYKIRIVVVVIVSSIALAIFGAAGAQIGGAPLCKAALRVLLGGWLAMSLTFGILRLLGGTTGF